LAFIYLTKEELFKIHAIAMERGGTNGILNEGMLELAVDAPKSTVFGKELHGSVAEKTASIFHELIKLHPFIDGNKRTALIAADTFLRINGYELRTRQQNIVDVAVKTAQCSMDISKIAAWVQRILRRRPAEQ